MNNEIAYNPPGLDDYIRHGAKINSALLRKMQGQPEPTETVGAKPDCAPVTCSAASNRLTDRLAQAEKTILDSKQVNDFEREITWRLFGVVSYYAKAESAKINSGKIKYARWLMGEIEDAIKAKVQRQNKD